MLYTKKGVPLQVQGDVVWDKAGRYVGRIQRSKVYGPRGRYIGTIVEDRLIYRSTDSATLGTASAPMANVAGSAAAHLAAVATWGDEPQLH
jgi:hypothetical protein